VFPYPVKEIQYYINNSCNLTCKNCISFNDLNFQGYYNWADSELKNKEWPKYILPGRISILGGEPFLHPNLLEWVKGVRSIWTNHNYITVATNGTFVNKDKPKKLIKEILDLGIQIEISIHNPSSHKKITENFLSILDDYNFSYRIETLWDEYTQKNDKQIIKSNNQIYGTISTAYSFENFYRSLTPIVQFFDNDTIKAHEVCSVKDCHYILNGDLYKCALVSTGKEFIKQHPIDLASTELLNRYAPCNPFDSAEDIENFLKTINNPIEQCSLCPTNKLKNLAL